MSGNNGRRWGRLALLVSLGLNLAIMGLAAGAFLTGPPEHIRTDRDFWSHARALPDPYRKDLGRELRKSRKDWREHRDSVAARREDLAAALTSRPFDISLVESILVDERESAQLLADYGTRLLVIEIGRMSPDERAIYARNLLTLDQFVCTY